MTPLESGPYSVVVEIVVGAVLNDGDTMAVLISGPSRLTSWDWEKERLL